MLKKMVARLLFPLPLAMELLLVGVVLLFFVRRWQRIGRWLVAAGGAVLLISTTPLVPQWAMRHLEGHSPKIDMQEARVAEPQWVVVLGGGHASDPRLPLSAQVGTSTLYRLTEGIRVVRQLPEATLLLSGYAGKDPVSNARIKAQLARALGYSGKIVLQERPRDTAEEAQQVAERVGQEPVVLVTSASHMRRAMALFRKQGVRPMPAPTGHLAPNEALQPWDWFPNALDAYRMQRAVYEYLGLGWAWMRGQL
ncbi:MAG: ElyC/SanA/YdcF family protein [Thermodesulfobacteriota bacterium]